MTEPLVSLVRQEWAHLLEHGALRVVDESDWTVTLHADRVGVLVVRDPRGEIAVSAYLLPDGESAYGWHYEGMVGRASEGRLLEIAAERLQEDPRVLGGDPELFGQIATERRRLSREWTDYYARKGPRPKTGHLP